MHGNIGIQCFGSVVEKTEKGNHISSGRDRRVTRKWVSSLAKPLHVILKTSRDIAKVYSKVKISWITQ